MAWKRRVPSARGNHAKGTRQSDESKFGHGPEFVGWNVPGIGLLRSARHSVSHNLLCMLSLRTE